MKMLGGVLILRGVATANMSTFKAQSQVHPRVAHLHALFANVLIGGSNPDLIEM